jgi:hypothetical protein
VNRLYFAYGSNLHPWRLAERAPSSTVIGTASLVGFALRFHKRSIDGSAKCDVVPDQSATVYGALFALDSRDLDALAAAEEGYERVELQVQAGGEWRTAFTFRARPERIAPDLAPYRWYRDLVAIGARYHDFPPDYLAAFERIATADDPDPARAAAMDALCRRLRERV